MKTVDFSPLQRHEPGRVALLFSGGKDSRAMIELFRPYLGGIIVYHNDTGDLWPETREYVAKVAETIPHFRRIETNAPAWIETVAIPSPLQPVDRSPLMSAMDGNRRRPVVSPLECCSSNQWRPISERVAANGMTLVIHGQRDCDYAAAGPVAWPLPEGIEEWPAISSWTDAQVFAYLDARGIERARFATENGRAPPGPDCATCPAGWAWPGRAAYLRDHHPDLAARYHAQLDAHAADIRPLLLALSHELQEFEDGRPTGGPRQTDDRAIAEGTERQDTSAQGER
jgi:hypothetical protein